MGGIGTANVVPCARLSVALGIAASEGDGRDAICASERQSRTMRAQGKGAIWIVVDADNGDRATPVTCAVARLRSGASRRLVGPTCVRPEQCAGSADAEIEQACADRSLRLASGLPGFRPAMRIAIIVSRRGPGGLWAFTCDACSVLAAAELNAAGGVHDCPVELTMADAGPTPSDAFATARRLVEMEGVQAVVGRHPSDVREAIAAGLGGRVPYVYTSMYEGGERDRNVLPTGATDDELLGYAVPLLMERRGARRFYIFGNDRMWPRSAALSAARVVARGGGRVVGVDLVDVGAEDYQESFARIAGARADVVIVALLGDEHVRFNRAFAEAGLAARMLRLSLGSDETVLYGGGADAHENLYVATTYVAGGRAGQDGFAERYRAGFGVDVPPATVFGRSCYEGVHLLAGLARAGRQGDAGAMRERFIRLTGPRANRGTLPPSLRHPSRRADLAEAQGLELRVVAVR